MTKTMNWPARVTYVLIALALALSLVLVAVPRASADPGLTEWTPKGTPTEADLVIQPGTDIISFDVSGEDGQTIYAIGTWYDTVNHGAPDYFLDKDGHIFDTAQVPKLWKSTDGGVTWKDLTPIKTPTAPGTDVLTACADCTGCGRFDFFSAVAVAPDNPDFFAVAGYNGTSGGWMVAGSDDGGDHFFCMGCDYPGDEILCMDISMEVSDTHNVAVGTYNGTSGDGGKIWRYEASAGYGAGSWKDTSAYGGWLDGAEWDDNQDIEAVTSVAFSPNFDQDDTILAVVAANATAPTYGWAYPAWHLVGGIWDSQNKWNTEAALDGYPVLIKNESNVIIASPLFMPDNTFFLRHATDLELPYDYNGEDSHDRVAMVAVNGQQYEPAYDFVNEGGYLFFAKNTKLSCELLFTEGNPWVSSIDYHGSVNMEGKAMVGLAYPETWDSSDILDWYMGAKNITCCQGVQVLRCENVDPCCPVWDWSQKPPTGQFQAQVAYTPDGKTGYASTEGCSRLAQNGLYADESAFSVSGEVGEVGDCWNQVGLIDTMIDWLADVAVNPACGTIYVASVNSFLGSEEKCCQCDSVWRSVDDGATYMRVWCKERIGSLSGDGVLGLAPEEEDEVTTIYMADRGTEYIYYADSGGLCKWLKRNSNLANITDIAVADESTVYALDFNGEVAKSTTHARRWSKPVKGFGTKDRDGHTIVVQGDNVLTGGSAGFVGYSADAGETFSAVTAPPDALGGKTHVAFDSYFADNDYVYAAVDLATGNVYRTTIAKSKFKSMNAEAYNYTGIVVSYPDGNDFTDSATGGVLYASYYNSTAGGSGAARCLNPAAETCCGELNCWDYLQAGPPFFGAVDFANQPSDLTMCGCLTTDTNTVLWAIDTRFYYNSFDWNVDFEFDDSHVGRIWTYEDCFAKAGPDLTAVDNGAVVPSDPCYCWNEQFVLKWDRICNACEYEIQVSLDEDFETMIYDTDFFTFLGYAGRLGVGGYYEPPNPAKPSLVILDGALECNTEYFWRVRSHYAETDEEIRSQWSDTWKFTVAVGPGGAISLTSPDDGATNVPVDSLVFTWTSVTPAASYVFSLMDASGAVIESKTGLAGTSYAYSGSLDNDTAYTWMVKAMSDGAVLSESSVSTFRTAPVPVPPPTPTPTPEPGPVQVVWPATPMWVWVVVGLGAVLVIVVIVLIFRTRKV